MNFFLQGKDPNCLEQSYNHTAGFKEFHKSEDAEGKNLGDERGPLAFDLWDPGLGGHHSVLLNFLIKIHAAPDQVPKKPQYNYSSVQKICSNRGNRLKLQPFCIQSGVKPYIPNQHRGSPL